VQYDVDSSRLGVGHNQPFTNVRFEDVHRAGSNPMRKFPIEMKRLLFVAILGAVCLWATAQAKGAPVWYGFNIHAGECERLSGFEGPRAFLEGARNPAEFLARLKARAPDAKLESFVAQAAAEAKPGVPTPAAKVSWLRKFSPTNAYVVSSEIEGIELLMIRSEVCEKLGLPFGRDQSESALLH
jgi:hypothetical protein